MRAKHFLPEAPIGLSNKRPARAGSRPDRGHNPVPLYKQDVNEFAPVNRGPWGDDEGSGEDPYKYPKPEAYGRSIDFFSQFEADHFDKEDMDDDTGVFKGYWDYDGELKQIAYFKFDDPDRTGSDDPGMGWYYEPQNESVEEGQLGTVLQWPEIVNKVNSVMKATGWKGERKGDDVYMFSSKGQETDDQFYFVIIDNAGEGFFTYALGTVEDGDPHIDDAYRGQLPNTEASVSELINTIRDGFGLNESLSEGKIQKQEAPKPRNFVAKNATTSGAGAHKDKKKAAKQGDAKHKGRMMDLAEMEAVLEKASLKLCKSSTPDEDLGASNLASCKSQGLRARDGKKSHKLGKSAKSRVTMDGHKIKGDKYGGPLPDWS